MQPKLFDERRTIPVSAVRAYTDSDSTSKAVWAWECPQCEQRVAGYEHETPEEIAADALCFYCRSAADG